MIKDVLPGRPFPLGATYDGDGTNFALFSENAESVEVCLFDSIGTETRVALVESTARSWHGYLRGVRPSQRYGFRVWGPWAPEAGHRFDPNKLLIDPYARAIDGDVEWHDDLFLRERDTAPFIPKSLVVDGGFNWKGDRLPDTPWHQTLIYEVHVKGFTQLNHRLDPEIRGTYAGLSSSVAIQHLKSLGVTAVELLPVHQHINDKVLFDKDLTNYWGYQTIGYFAPHNGYSSSGSLGQQVDEFKRMVRSLHAAGIEVILDVVYNHTGEGDENGPTLGFRGIDNRSYYRYEQDDPSRYVDYTGTGNSLNMRHPNVLQLMMDSLRYWVTEMHVDGFRFDLAAALARELHDVDRLSSFFDVIQQDPVIGRVKLIAEPWDLGQGGYQVGNFPPLWSEWNGEYRDCIRDFWRGRPHSLPEFAYRLTGSSDLYQDDGRHPSASINFVTAHDGFVLHDLVAYEEKHNMANGEGNNDGENNNRSWNCGVEGETEDPDINRLRARQQRNLLLTLFLSQGVPMLLGGDEIDRSQGGNNNAYCHDNEVSWLNWSLGDKKLELLEFTRRISQLRESQPVLRRRRFFKGHALHGSGVTDIAWFTSDGREMSDDDWAHSAHRSLAVFLNGDEIDELDANGKRIVGDSLLLLFNAGDTEAIFTIPPDNWGLEWDLMLDTDDPAISEGDRRWLAGDKVPLRDRSLVVLRRAR